MSTSKLLSDLLLTIIVAILLSSILYIALAFLAGNLNMGEQGQIYASSISNVVLGLIIGFRLGKLIRDRRKK